MVLFQALTIDLTFPPLFPSILLQYIEDLLIYRPPPSHSQSDTIPLLYFSSSRHYQVSPPKAQISTPQVTNLQLSLNPTHKHLTLS